MENLRDRKHLNLDNPNDLDWLYDWAKLAQKELTELREKVSRVELPVILPKPNPTVCKLQSLLVEADAIRTEIQGMETFNDERIRQGNSVGYSQEHFSEMAEQLRNVAKQMKELANTCKPACERCKHRHTEEATNGEDLHLCQNPKIRLWNLTNCDIDITEFGCTYFESKSV